MTVSRRSPPEWAPQSRTLLAWPYHEGEWGDALAAAQQEWGAFAGALTQGGCALTVLVRQQDRRLAEATLRASAARLKDIAFLDLPYDDIWLRDTSPWFCVEHRGAESRCVAIDPNFNGWGGKYRFPQDEALAAALAEHLAIPLLRTSLVFEGGALESNGEGLALTTRTCLLDGGRNTLSEDTVARELCQQLGFDDVVFVDRGLQNDHTDGHIDTLARFSNEETVLCMKGEAEDPNKEALDEVEEVLRSLSSTAGRAFRVETVPSPGAVRGTDGALLPASYMNFVLTPKTVLVPTYGQPADAQAVAAIGEHFPGRHAIGLASQAILSGGGAFHCISKEVPAKAEATTMAAP